MEGSRANKESTFKVSVEGPSELPNLLTVVEVADRLRISRAKTYELIKRGELEAFRPGGRLRVSESVVEKYLERTKVA